jgi:succinate-semialdehyde dehydrogenase/glutarate-semialdehyde dehydrogenase
VIREPVGPVAALTAGNFPALLPARKLGAALGAGCSVVLKPAEATPRSALFLAALLQDAGLPAGVLNVVTGDPGMISRELMGSRHIRMVSLTGSVEVGRQLLALAAHGIKPSTMELGGHAAALVFPDADLDLAANAIVGAKFRNCGQVCITVSRLLAHHDISDDLLALVTAKTRALTVGCGTDQSAQVGPLASARAVRHVEELVDDARARGAVIETGGRLATATRAAEGLEAGMVGVNRTVIATAEAPAGGVKASGFGREGGSEALENYTTSKYISLGLGL